MKKLMLAVAFLGLTMMGNAMNNGEGKGKRSGEAFNAEKAAEKKVNRLSDSIEMTDAQKKSMTTTFQSYYKKMHELRAAETKDKAAFKKAKEARDAEVKTILNNEAKYTKYQTMTARKHKKGDAHKKGEHKGKHKGKKGGKDCKGKDGKKKETPQNKQD